MARKSKKQMQSEDLERKLPASEISYVAIYARLSKEDTDFDTLETQIDLLKSYVAEQKDMSLKKVFYDNGFSGTNYNRPQFTEMMEEVKNGSISCIVVKDLSRLGRNYIETGEYIDKVFPFLGIRFVAVTDGFDTAQGNGAEAMIVSLKNLINDVYAKDISRKIISAFRTKQKNGEYIGLVAPYGFLKDPENKNHFLIDEKTAPVVQLIFNRLLQGDGVDKIARLLNEKGISAPRRYRYEIGITKSDRYADSMWGRSAIKTILTNQAYIGDMVQGKVKQELCNHISKQYNDKSEWIVAENTHEAIVDREIFYKVQEILETRTRKMKQSVEKSQASGIKEENYLKGYIRCGSCGHAVNLSQTVRGSAITRQYYCGSYVSQRGMGCENKHRINKPVLEQCVLEAIKKLIFQLLDESKLKVPHTAGRQIESINHELQIMKKKISQANSRIANLYDDYEEGILDDTDYLNMKLNYQHKLEVFRAEEKALQGKKKNMEKQLSGEKQLSDILKRYRNSTQLDRMMVECFVEKISIYDKTTIDIRLKGRDMILQSLMKGDMEDAG